MIARRFVCLLISGVIVLSAQAQGTLQTPDDFLGYELGTQFTPHHRVVAYVEHVAAHTPNVHVEQYGETYEERPLLVAFVSTPEQLERLEAIRVDNLKRAGLMEGSPSGREAPALVWLSYNVHGNESVSTEAAMRTLYDLADPNNAETQRWLEEAVVVIDPCLNPDGRERYVNWYKQVVGRTPMAAPEAREHHEPWPGGRVNHYYFDLNRDWSWATQQETRQRLALYNRWLPHVHVDFHEQGVEEPYYFAPAAEPFHARISDWQRSFQTTIGKNHARYFDREGWLYFTRQRFDLLYPGYGDTWPIFNGAVGMTYEQGGSGRAGLAIRTAEGDTLTLRQRIAHHHTTGLSTVEAAATHRADVVQEFQNYFAQPPEGPYKTFLIKAGSGADKLKALAAHLDQQGIRYSYAAQAQAARGTHYTNGQETRVQVEPGDLIIGVDQPKRVLAKVLFEPQTYLSDSLTYDITAWALPYVYGLDAYALGERIAEGTSAPATDQASASNILNQPYAYLAEWKSLADLQFLAAVLQEGIKLRFSELPFEVDGRRYGRGTLVLTRKGNEALGDRFDATVRAVAARLGQPLHAVGTGFVTSGPDFGSSDVPFLNTPRVAVLAGEPTSHYALGTVWHFLDQQLKYPALLINADDLSPTALKDVDVLILPSGSYSDVLTDARLEELRSWIQTGGRLIAMERAASYLVGKEGFMLKAKEKEEAKAEDEKQPEAKDPAQRLRTYAEREREAIREDVPGAIFRVRLDGTHPLAFGYDDTYFTLKQGDDAYAFLEGEDNWNVGVVREDALVSGFAGAEAQKQLTNSLVFGVQDMGRGEVVYLIDNPLFRGFWYNGGLLFGNAVFLVGQ